MKIFLDAGHNYSGADTGATNNGLKEQDITYAIAQKVGERLKNAHIEVKYSRNNITDNIGSTLPESINLRCKMANLWNAHYFVSIHCNSFSDAAANGTETLIYSKGGEAEDLANIVNARLVQLGLTNRGVKVRTDLGVLKGTIMPSILIETAFITNIGDSFLLNCKQDELAQAIANGIFEFLELEVKTLIETPEQAIKKLADKGIISSPDYWTSAYQIVNHLDILLIKFANAIG